MIFFELNIDDILYDILQCDEQHPYCINCTRADRVCSYGLETPPIATPSVDVEANSAASDTALTPSSSEHSGRQVILTEKFDNFAAAADCGSDFGDGDSINMDHLKLFEHFRGDNFMLANIDWQTPIADIKEIFVREAFSAPYLMYECLAFAARHLSVEGPPDMKNFYLEQAITLQTRALAIFNASTPVINEDTCLAHFIFSNLLAQHTLVDTLAFRDSSLELFIGHFLNYIGLNRGVESVCRGSWPYLMKSELRPVLLHGIGSKPPP